MTDSVAATPGARPSGFATAINVLTAPSDAFRHIREYPSKLFPLALVLLPSIAVMLWYFLSVDYAWYVDDVLAQTNVEGEDLEQARESMLAMSRNTFMLLGMLGSSVFIALVYLLQAMYLSLAAALMGSRYHFGHWFSLACWAGLPYLVSVLGMAVNIALSSNGQLGATELDPLTLANLGLSSSNGALQALFNAASLTMLWGLALMTIAWRQWLEAGWVKAAGIVCAPYALIFGVWAYFAVS